MVLTADMGEGGREGYFNLRNRLLSKTIISPECTGPWWHQSASPCSYCSPPGKASPAPGVVCVIQARQQPHQEDAEPTAPEKGR